MLFLETLLAAACMLSLQLVWLQLLNDLTYEILHACTFSLHE